MSKRLTKKQKDFADKYLETGNATQSAVEVYDTNRDVARRIGSENLTKPDIRAYLDSHVDMAKSVIVEIASNTDNKPNDRITAAKDILDRTIGKPKDVAGEGIELRINLSAEQAEQLIRARANRSDI